MINKLLYYIRQYFGFSRKQTYGVAILLLLLLNFFIVTGIAHYYQLQQHHHFAQTNAQRLDNLVEELEKANVKKAPTSSRSSYHLSAPLDINKASENDLRKLYGIGVVRAKRIIAYRKCLGGFLYQHQYKEIYNLPPEVIATLKEHTLIAKDFIPKKININNASLHTLASHPYITYTQAKAILAYKKQHGKFRSTEDIKKLHCLHGTTLKKILPYLTYKNEKSQLSEQE